MTAPTTKPIGTRYGVPGKLWKAGHHTGVDYLCPTGSVLVAPEDSHIVEVSSAGTWGASYGIHVVGECTVGGRVYRWIAAHMSKTEVKVGQSVKAGQRLGLSGATGNVTGPHCHFEVRVSPFRYGSDVDPKVLTTPRAAPNVRLQVTHTNIDQYMGEAKIKADVAAFFELGSDIIGINEAIAATRSAVKAQAKAHGHGVFFGPGALNQLGIAWRRSKLTVGATWAKTAIGGVAGLSPARGAISVRGTHTKSRQTISPICAHLDSKAYSTNDKRTKLRRVRWHVEYRMLVARAKWLTLRRDVVFVMLDANRSLGSWPGDHPFPALTTSVWAKKQATAVVPTTAPDFGKTTYIYLVILSRKHHVVVTGRKNTELHSDHDAVTLDVEWV